MVECNPVRHPDTGQDDSGSEDEVPLAETIYSALKRLASDDSTVEYDEGGTPIRFTGGSDPRGIGLAKGY